MCILSRKLNYACRLLYSDDIETFVFMAMCHYVHVCNIPFNYCKVSQQGLHLSHTRSQIIVVNSYLTYGSPNRVEEPIESGAYQTPSRVKQGQNVNKL